MYDRWPGKGATASGFTLLELMIVVTILGILTTIGVPQYTSALRVARVGKAKHDLVSISHRISEYSAANQGALPLTLHQVGYGGKLDPWGVPYCYLNYVDGTGDGLEWAVAAGLVDPSAFISHGGSTHAGSRGLRVAALPAPAGRGGVVAPRDASAPRERPSPQGPVVVDAETPVGRDAKAAADALIATVRERIPRTLTVDEAAAITTAVQTVGAGAVGMFTSVPVAATRRRDRYMFPLNTDYDLFSLGPDGRTSVSLGEGVGLDDVIRANNGGFFGPAADY